MSRDRILERIRKLDSLSTSSNQHEADTARRMAEDLKRHHQVTDEEIGKFESELSTEFPVELKDGEDFEDPWKFKLLSAAADFYGCGAILLKLGVTYRARVIGSKIKVKETSDLFASLMKDLKEIEASVPSKLEDFEWAISQNPGCIRLAPDLISYSVRCGIADRLIHELRIFKNLNEEKSRSQSDIQSLIVTGLEIAKKSGDKKEKTTTVARDRPTVKANTKSRSEFWYAIAYEIAHYRNGRLDQEESLVDDNFYV